jgi:DNA polymerase-3 subunit epsilon
VAAKHQMPTLPPPSSTPPSFPPPEDRDLKADEPNQSAPPDPPAGDPWDEAIETAPFAFLDLEMTGLDVTCDRVIEICVERRRGDRIEDRLETLIDPGASVVFTTDVHGIAPAALTGAPHFETLADRILALLDGAVLVAHAAPWDVAFLEAELARCGRPHRFAWFLDTLTLSRRAFMAESHSLGALAERLQIARGQAHRAGDDVRVLTELFTRLLRELSPKAPRDLWYVRVGEKKARPDVVAACIVLADSGQKTLLCYRPSHKGPRTIVGIITQVRTDLDPPRVMGYALPSRGRFDLRADRILSVAAQSGPESEPKSP